MDKRTSCKSKKITWEQPDKDEEIYLGMVNGKVFFMIERKGYKLYCSGTPQAIIGIYDDWGHDLEKLKKKALVALESKGIVNHILN